MTRRRTASSCRRSRSIRLLGTSPWCGTTRGEDLGTGGPGDTDGVPNDDAQFWGAFSTDGGQTFTANIQISAGTSNSHDSGNAIDYGDYSGLSFYGGEGHPAWAGNSHSTRDKPEGTLPVLGIY